MSIEKKIIKKKNDLFKSQNIVSYLINITFWRFSEHNMISNTEFTLQKHTGSYAG